jgi:hypothetical protein
MSRRRRDFAWMTKSAKGSARAPKSCAVFSAEHPVEPGQIYVVKAKCRTQGYPSQPVFVADV